MIFFFPFRPSFFTEFSKNCTSMIFISHTGSTHTKSCLIFFTHLHISANAVNNSLYLWVASVLRSKLLARARISIAFGNVYSIKNVWLKSTMHKARCHHPWKPDVRMNSNYYCYVHTYLVLKTGLICPSRDSLYKGNGRKKQKKNVSFVSKWTEAHQRNARVLPSTASPAGNRTERLSNLSNYPGQKQWHSNQFLSLSLEELSPEK